MGVCPPICYPTLPGPFAARIACPVQLDSCQHRAEYLAVSIELSVHRTQFVT